MSAIEGTPRLRVIAGPNGSGKTTFFKDLSKNVPIGHWLNPDEIELNLARGVAIDLAQWNLTIEQADLHEFFRRHGLFEKLGVETLPAVRDDKIESRPALAGTYFAAILSAFLRRRWMATSQSFTFETVMSHAGKLDLLRDARTAGYRTYLYFVCTDSHLINVDRVSTRVLDGGHTVPADKIVERYDRSLTLLQPAIALCHRAYLFDNSGTRGHRLLAEFEDGRLRSAASDLPAWSVEYAIKFQLENDAGETGADVD